MGVHLVVGQMGVKGYSPVDHLVRLATELLDAELIEVGCNRPGVLQRFEGELLARSRRGADDCVMVCTQPAHLFMLLRLQNWRKRYRRVVAWVFDSFWVQECSRFVRKQRHFDHVFVTEPEDLAEWRYITGVDVTWLPWGSDVLRLGSYNPRREVDMLRFGRQPNTWEDDERTATACANLGLRYEGRPRFATDPSENEKVLAHQCSQSKFTLSFSNRVSPSSQTHPFREYITSRWTVALGAGAIVAGVPPQSEVTESLLWPEALLRLSNTELALGLETIGAAVQDWTPQRAALNYQRALERLDWRWRLKEIALSLGPVPKRLAQEIAELEACIRTLKAHARAGGADAATVMS